MKQLLWVSLVIMVGSYISLSIGDPDLWWHITIGRWIVSHQTVPRVDYWNMFSGDKLWRAYSWSNEVLLALVDQWAGEKGLLIFQILLACSLAGTLFYIYGRIARDYFVGSLLGKQSPEAHLHRGRLELINPEIIERSARIVSSEEGCLSIPDYRDTIKRHEGVTVQAQDRLGRLYKVAAIELLAFALQHEIDHLHGTLFVDHLSRLKKVLFRKWCAKNNVELEA